MTFNIWILARYDIVRLRTMSYVHPTTSYVRRTMSCSTSHVRYRTHDITYDIVHTTSYVCQHRRCNIRHRMSDIRYRRFPYDIVGLTLYIVYDVVGAYRIRCRMFTLEHTMSYVSYDIVHFYYFAQNLRHRRYTYDIVCMTYDVVFLSMRSVPAAETSRRPPAGACQHGRSFSRDFRLFPRLSVSRSA